MKSLSWNLASGYKKTENKNVHWVELNILKEMLMNQEARFYPMHITTLKKYITHRKTQK